MGNEQDKAVRELQTAIAMMGSQIEWISDVLEGRQVSDFALSFPLVRAVDDLKRLTDFQSKRIEDYQEELSMPLWDDDSRPSGAVLLGDHDLPAIACRMRAKLRAMEEFLRKWSSDGWQPFPDHLAEFNNDAINLLTEEDP